MRTEGIIKKIRPGDEIITYCGRCHQERTHQIIALNSEGQADRVVCRFCQSNHLYRGRKTGGKNASKDGPSSNKMMGSSRAAAEPLLPYTGKEVYAAGDLILHPKFGQGRVIEARSGKIEVKFGSKEVRILLHAG